MANEPNLPQESPAKKRKLSPDRLAPPEDMHIWQRSPSPDSPLATVSRGIRGIISNLRGGSPTNEVINGATPEPSNFFSNAFSTIGSQIPRLSEDFGLVLATAKTKLLKGGIVDDKHYDVSAKAFRPRVASHQTSSFHC